MTVTAPSMFIGSGIYSIREASALTSVPARRIRRWLCGYRFKTSASRGASDPVFVKQLLDIDGEIAASFLDLIEVRIVNSLRIQKISWNAIRSAQRHAQEIFGVDHPFATKNFRTDGRTIFADLKRKHGERGLLDLAKNQLAFRSFVEPHLKDIDFDSKQRAARWWPMGSKRRVVLDPQRSFGQPIVREGVPTAVLAHAVKKQGSLKTVANWYDIELRAVEDAVEFEEALVA